MKIIRLDTFKKDYKALPARIQKKMDTQLRLLLTDHRHPSLRIKKMKGKEDIWEGTVTKSYRFTFKIEGDRYILRRIGTHDILRKEA